jgi:hypothetical protein
MQLAAHTKRAIVKTHRLLDERAQAQRLRLMLRRVVDGDEIGRRRETERLDAFQQIA